MIDVSFISFIILLIIFTIDAFITFVYTFSIIFVRQFHTTHNILLGNLSCISFISACYFIFYSIEFYLYPTTWYRNKSFCFILSYCPLVLQILIVYSFVTITINRYLIIVYSNKPFFKQRRWALISLLTHWFVSISLGMSKFSAAFQVYFKCEN